jgi:hypothetical protein
MRRITSFLFILSILIFSSSNVFAEFIVLKSGITLEGKVISKTDFEITVEMKDGEQIPYMMSEVVSISDHRPLDTDSIINASVDSTTPQGKIDALNAQRDEAVQRVKEIVNQPVTSVPREPDMNVQEYSPGWFHPSAKKPDFNKTDVRKSQKFSYDQYEYVTSDLNPGVVFVGKELEFNSKLKYFYTDRSVPKKKLSEDEMLEINKLFRVIGHCDQQLADLQNTTP